MTRLEMCEELQNKVKHNQIITIDELFGEDIYPYEDVLEPIDYNWCDVCRGLYPSEDMYWIDDVEDDHDLIEAIEKRVGESGKCIDVFCKECAKKLKGEK